MMPEAASRVLISELAEDLGWLEEHCRRQPEHADQTTRLRLAAALVRNNIGPFLDGQPPLPLHIAVVGGAGAGKSTVTNLLTGATLAEANPQAGFTRHPIAYMAADRGLGWTGHLGFLGPLRRLTQPEPANLDDDVYQVRPVPAEAAASPNLLDQFVVWDCPDMTAWAATGYVARMLEVAGLADIIVYVASDERYNDEVPTQYLRLFLEAGKPVVVCLVKMKETDAASIIQHFQREVLDRMPGGAVPCVTIPMLTREQLANPAALAARERIPLLNQIMVLGEPPATARLRSVRRAANYLVTDHQALLGAARRDVEALQEWRGLVEAGRVEFEDRYRREYLTSQKFQRFDEALLRLLELLEVPGAGKVVSSTLWVLRTPYRLLKGFLTKTLTRPEAPPAPEYPVLERALQGWLDLLRKEAARRAAAEPVWAHIDRGFHGRLTQDAEDQFRQDFRSFQLGLTDEVERTARAIYEDLEKNPALLNALRGGKLAIDVAAVAAAALTAGVHWGLDFVLVPLAASVTHQLVELMGRQYVDNQRDLARRRQQELVTRCVARPLAEWLAQWPASGGSPYERLNLALRRLPADVQQLQRDVEEAARRQNTTAAIKMAV